MTLIRKDVNLEQKLIYPTTAKKGNARTLKISANLLALFKHHISTHNKKPEERLFKSSPRQYGKTYRALRNKVANKLNRPELRSIRLYDFRHYFATRLYAKTKDILLVKQQLGHRNIENTLVYTQLIATNEDEEYTCKAVNNKEDAMKLIENGFRFEDEIDGYKLYRKRK